MAEAAKLAEDARMKKDRKKKRSTAKGNFHRIYNSMIENKIGEESEPIEVLLVMLNELENMYANFQEKSEEFVEVLDSDNEDEKSTIKGIEDDLTLLYEELCTVRKKVSIRRKTEEDKIKKETGTSEEKFSRRYETIKTKRLDAPQFSGKIRDYPSFKLNYKRHMTPVYGDDPYALRICLTGDANLAIKGVEDDYVKMFERLDAKYGCPQKLVDSIFGELKALKKVPEGDMKKLVQMIEIVERSWLDLQRMKMSDEMNTTMMISFVEKLLPDLQRREWAIYKQSKDSIETNKKFPEMLDFLLREKTAIEYMSDDVRGSNISDSSKGRVHSYDSHIKENEGTFVQGMADMQSSMKLVIEGLAQVSQAMSNSVAMKKPYQSDYAYRTGEKGDRNINRYCWMHSFDGHDIRECSLFKSLDVNARLDAARKHFVCFCCLKKGHISRRCLNKVACPVNVSDNEVCGMYHDKLLHMENRRSVNSHVSQRKGKQNKRDNVMLMVSTVYSGASPLAVLWDPGANLSLISKERAGKMGLKGRDVMLSITKVGNVTETIQSKEYVIPLIDRRGTSWFVTVYEIEEISAEVGEIDVNNIAKLFHNVTADEITRPSGKIDLLIGLDWCKLMPTTIEENGNLQLMQNQFGFCIRGSHPSLSNKGEGYSFQIKVHLFGGVVEEGHINSVQFKQLHNMLESFMDIEQMGISVNPKCGGCECGRCMNNEKNCSIQEVRETRMLEEGLTYNKEEKRWTIKFPFIKDPNILPNNVVAAVARLKSTERRLSRLGKKYMDQYNEQIQDMIKRKVACPISHWEKQHYTEPVHYIPHHEVLKATSTSTPLRIVFNPSSSYMGHVLNDYWPKGANLLTDMLAIMLRFRQFRVAIVGDIKKMYNAVALSYYDQHIHRFLWRNMDVTKAPTHYKMLALTFGDRPSGNIATLALRKTAQMSKNEYSEAFKLIDQNCYVDDLLRSVEETEMAKQLMKETEKVLNNGGFKIKHWICSNMVDSCQKDNVEMNIIKPEYQRVLGMVWNPETDMFKFQIDIKTPFMMKQSTEKGDVEDKVTITPRQLVSLLASIYDPMGLLLPYIIEGKLLMRKAFATGETSATDLKQKWDIHVDIHIQKKWEIFVRKLHLLKNITFPRCLQVIEHKGNPELLIFSDASEQAYATCAYVRWKINPDNYKCNLIMAKNRLAPKRISSIPRLELCAAVIASRLRKKIEKEMEYEFVRIFHFTDSMIVRDQIKNESREFKTYTAVRLSEIQENSETSEWFWIPSEDNPADLATRAKDVITDEELNMWQNGPSFVQQPFENWPLTLQKEDKCEDLPDYVGNVLNIQQEKCEVDVKDVGIIDLMRFNKYKNLIIVTCIVINVLKKKSFKLDGEHRTGLKFREAERRWVQVVQGDFGDDWAKQFQRLGVEKDEEGFITVGKRLAEWFGRSWNPKMRILLPYDNRFTYLYVKMIHEKDHSIDATIAKVRHLYWIPRLVKLVKHIKDQCVTCKKVDKRIIGQVMGPMPIDRLIPNPAFSICAVDLFGPLTIRDSVKKRCRSKCYGVLFNCLTCRATYIDIAEGYDTESFLICLRRFIAVRGCPQKILSDRGSQLVSASKELAEVTKDWNWNQIYDYGTEKGLVWQFTKSADAPWENGCSEALIRLAKRNLMLAVGSNVLTFSELQMVVFEVSNLLNERPIAMKSSNPVKMDYLCPNDLILGRASSRVPPGSFDEKCDPKRRHKFCQIIVDDFWKRWHRFYFDTLIIQQKWHTTRRNVCVGDIVLLQDSNNIRGKWQLAEVCEATPGSDGNVRDVKVRYKSVSDFKDYTGTKDIIVNRSVHRLVLILPAEENK